MLALGQVIAQARRKNKLTQQQLCDQAGIAYSTLTKIERGAIKKPNIFLVLQIAKAINCQIEDLLDHQSPISVDTQEDLPSKEEITPSPKKPKIKFIYFDLFGVLVEEDNSNIIRYLALKTKNTPHFVENLFLQHETPLLKGILTVDEFNKILQQQLGDTSLDWKQIYIKTIRMQQDVLNICHQVMEQYSVGLLTNAFVGNVETMLEADILPKFKIIVDSSKIGLTKPGKAIYEYAQEKAGVQPQEILFIDDRPLNIMAAQNYGWQGVLLDPPTRGHLKERLAEILDF